MADEISELYDGTEARALRRKVDLVALRNSISDEVEESNINASALIVAAYTSTATLFETITVDDLVAGGPHELANSLASKAAQSWLAFLEHAAALSAEAILPKHLLYFSACGLLARRHTDVRTMLRKPFARSCLESDATPTAGRFWIHGCEASVIKACILLTRQEHRQDVDAAAQAIDQLAKDHASEKANVTHGSAADSISSGYYVISLFHLAQATSKTSHYLVTGRSSGNEEKSGNFEPELRRLLTKAEEIAETGGGPEEVFTVRGIAALLWALFESSVWRQARGLSKGVDELLEELAGRETPIFSLLPSQQEALRSHLMDRAQVAVVLQMPTSAGKTLLSEFYILQAIEAYKRSARVLYLAPTRALCTQTYRTLVSDLGPLKIAVQQASSAFEEDPYEMHLLSGMSEGVVVATPEKADLLLRAHPKWFEAVKLVVVDEAHLLSDKERGVRLELLLANIKREHPTATYLLLTPFVDNAAQIARWLGGDRAIPIHVKWRPSRVLVGLAKSRRENKRRVFSIEWKEPFSTAQALGDLELKPSEGPATSSTMDSVVSLHSSFGRLGLTLGMFPSSKQTAEDAASKIAHKSARRARALSDEAQVAIALASAEFGDEAPIVQCLQGGTAFHHSSLSPELRFLIEDLGRRGELEFLAATTTLAQGINFPVASVLVHSLHKPFGQGNLSPSEFWNIAGRAGRVGLADKGIVVFANQNHRDLWTSYSEHLSESITSGLLTVLSAANQRSSLKDAYRDFPQVRPFIQYLAHAAATVGPRIAAASLEELLEASLANALASDRTERRALRAFAQRYLFEIANKQEGYLKAADVTGFSSFSFDELYAKIHADPVLSIGPEAVLNGGSQTLTHLITALAWLPELELGLGNGPGKMDAGAVGKVVLDWISGSTIQEIAPSFKGDESEADRVRRAGAYVFSTISQTLSWGAHAYIRGWIMRSKNEPSEVGAMLPSYIQHGVNTPEAAVASLIGVPRLLAQPLGQLYRSQHGPIKPNAATELRAFIESGDSSLWEKAICQSKLANRIDGMRMRKIWRRMRGLEP